MKKLKLTAFCVSVAILATLGTGFASAESNGVGHVDPEYTIHTPYDYPVRPGTQEWVALEDNIQKIDVTQIPENILHAMTTEALVDTVLDYPLLMNMYVFNTYTEGFEAIAEQFNGMQELLARPDGAEKLLERYAQPPVAVYSLFSEVEPEEQNGFKEFSHLEMMLSQPGFYEKLNDTELTVLEEKAAEVNEEVQADPDCDSPAMFYRVVAENQIISTYGFEIPFYIDGGGDYNQQPGAGTYINTPKGTRVFLSFKQDMSAVYKTKVKDYLAGVYPNAYFLGEATWKYNCHAYAWYFQNSSGMGWMNSPAAYWQDGSYFRVLSPMASDKVYYSAQDHSAILRSLPSADSPYSVAQVTSKWSQAGLYTHKAADCPYWTSSTDLKFYRKA